jgi:mono/diheme cytochrome c family protein
MGTGNVEVGGKLYQTRCAPCHGPDGKAATPTAQALNPKPRDHADGARSYCIKPKRNYL